ncbi:class E sortase [Streptomyces fructofermentans]|uniref:class E sortase n=1 Tax=Streptomyces fructofermentans TaxID=152141 RepID=UPI00378863B8
MRVPVVHQRARRRRARWARVLRTGAEALVTLGVVLLLLVVHQLWWTNRQAREGAEREVRALERQWDGQDPPGTRDPLAEVLPGTGPGTEGADGTGGGGSGDRAGTAVPDPAATPGRDRAYAVLTIPRLSVRVPVAEGVGKPDVLNKGYAGHYPGTARPGAAGNFALAGHRNTHGEPFRHIDRLRRGDELRVETRSAVHTYVVDRTLPRTSPGDTGVIGPVPRSAVHPGYGYGAPGHYLTLTTCTPEYSSAYRLVVWARLAATRPRPDTS